MGNSFTKKDCGQSNEETSSDNSTSDSNQKEWTLLASDTIETWKFSSVLYGFEPRIDYTSDIKGRLQPWCTFGRYFSVKYDSIEKALDRHYMKIVISEGCFHSTQVRLPRSYHSRLHTEPEPASHFLKPIQVVGYRGGVCILQVNCKDHFIEFLVIHMKTGTILGTHKENIQGYKHYLCDCLISPDLSSFILKPNAMYVLNFARDTFDSSMKVISCKGNPMPVIKENLFNNVSVRAFIAYDPRYTWRRIVIGNYCKHGKDTVIIYDLKSDKIIQSSDPYSHYQTTHNISWSPDGAYISSMVLGRTVKDGFFNFPKVLIYESTELLIIQSISTNYLSEVPTLSPSGMFPVFNNTGTIIAIPYGEHGTYFQQVAGVKVYKAPNILDLQSLCRLCIRQYFETYDVDRLPLPKKLKDYLKFKPFWE